MTCLSSLPARHVKLYLWLLSCPNLVASPFSFVISAKKKKVLYLTEFLVLEDYDSL